MGRGTASRRRGVRIGVPSVETFMALDYAIQPLARLAIYRNRTFTIEAPMTRKFPNRRSP